MRFFIRLLFCAFMLVGGAWGGGIYWTNRGKGLLERARFDGENKATVLADAGSNVRGIALDLANGRIYYADNGADIIYRLNLDGAGRSVVAVTGPSSFPADLRLDLAKGQLYYCDQQKALLQRINLDGSGAKTLVEDRDFQPYYLDLDLEGGKLYWGDFDGVTSNTGNIFRANLDGTGRETIVTGNLETRAVCLDAKRGMLYWVNRNAGKIQSCPLAALPVDSANSSTVRTLYSGLDTPHGMVLDFHAEKVYWVDTGTNGFDNTKGDRAISRGDMDGSGPHEVIVDLQSDPWDIDVDPRCRDYADWVARYFVRNPGASGGRLADPENDRVVNLLEYALGRRPWRSDGQDLVDVGVWKDPGTGELFPTIRFTRRATAVDLVYAPQASEDTKDWTEPAFVEVAKEAREEGMEVVTLRASVGLSQGAPRFLRLRVATR